MQPDPITDAAPETPEATDEDRCDTCATHGFPRYSRCRTCGPNLCDECRDRKAAYCPSLACGGQDPAPVEPAADVEWTAQRLRRIRAATPPLVPHCPACDRVLTGSGECPSGCGSVAQEPERLFSQLRAMLAEHRQLLRPELTTAVAELVVLSDRLSELARRILTASQACGGSGPASAEVSRG